MSDRQLTMKFTVDAKDVTKAGADFRKLTKDIYEVQGATFKLKEEEKKLGLEVAKTTKTLTARQEATKQLGAMRRREAVQQELYKLDPSLAPKAPGRPEQTDRFGLPP